MNWCIFRRRIPTFPIMIVHTTHKERVQAILSRKPVDRMPVDIWHTPEIEAALKREYGEDVIFQGGVNNQRILPFGTPDDVRR